MIERCRLGRDACQSVHREMSIPSVEFEPLIFTNIRVSKDDSVITDLDQRYQRPGVSRARR